MSMFDNDNKPKSVEANKTKVIRRPNADKMYLGNHIVCIYQIDVLHDIGCALTTRVTRKCFSFALLEKFFLVCRI